MRKRMSRMKKEMAVAVAAAMCISLVGCGGGSSKKVVAEGQKVHCAFLQDTLIVWVPVQYDIIVPIIVQHGLRVATPRHDVLKKEVQLVGLHGG